MARRPRAVVCDDDRMARQVVAMVLADCGVDVVGEADNAAGVIELNAQLVPEFVILDTSLPGMSGLEAIPALRDANPKGRIVVCSAFDSGQSAIDAGADAAVDKAEMSELEATVKRLK